MRLLLWILGAFGYAIHSIIVESVTVVPYVDVFLMKKLFHNAGSKKVLYHHQRSYKIRVFRLCCEKYRSQLVRNVDSDECVCNTRLRLVLKTSYSPKSTFPHQLRNILFQVCHSIFFFGSRTSDGQKRQRRLRIYWRVVKLMFFGIYIYIYIYIIHDLMTL